MFGDVPNAQRRAVRQQRFLFFLFGDRGSHEGIHTVFSREIPRDFMADFGRAGPQICQFPH